MCPVGRPGGTTRAFDIHSFIPLVFGSWEWETWTRSEHIGAFSFPTAAAVSSCHPAERQRLSRGSQRSRRVAVTWLFTRSLSVSAQSRGFTDVCVSGWHAKRNNNNLRFSYRLIISSYLMSLRVNLSSLWEEGRTFITLTSRSLLIPVVFACLTLFLCLCFCQDVVVASGFTVSKSPTVLKDKLHPCNLMLKGDDACVYVRTRTYMYILHVRKLEMYGNITVTGMFHFKKCPIIVFNYFHQGCSVFVRISLVCLLR